MRPRFQPDANPTASMAMLAPTSTTAACCCSFLLGLLTDALIEAVLDEPSHASDRLRGGLIDPDLRRGPPSQPCLLTGLGLEFHRDAVVDGVTSLERLGSLWLVVGLRRGPGAG